MKFYQSLIARIQQEEELVVVLEEVLVDVMDLVVLLSIIFKSFVEIQHQM